MNKERNDKTAMESDRLLPRKNHERWLGGRLALLLGLAAVSMLGVAAEIKAKPSNDGAEWVVRNLFEAFNRHDLAALSNMYDANAEILSPDHGTLHGPEGIRKIYGPLFTQFPDIRDHVSNILAVGDQVAIEFVAKGCAAGGKDCFELPIAAFITVRNGRIVRDASYFYVLP